MALLIYAALLALYFNPALGSPPQDFSLRVRSPPGQSEGEAIQGLRRELGFAALSKREEEYKVSTTLQKSWDDAVLLQLEDEFSNRASGNIIISCTTCYLKGFVTGELVFSHGVNVSYELDQTIDQVASNISNFTKEAEQYIWNYTEALKHQIEDTGLDTDDFVLPTLNYSLDFEIPPMPDVTLHVAFDGLELYMLIDASLSGDTYTCNLFTSEPVAGFGEGSNLELGAVFIVDLILAADGLIDISNGFHLKFDDDLTIDIALFDEDITDLTLNGGQFELLPVTVESAGVAFRAILRVGAQVGVSIGPGPNGSVAPPKGTTVSDNIMLSYPDVGGGIEVAVFAYVADLTTNTSYQHDSADCELAIEQTYQFALGAAAGATIAATIGSYSHTWGPVAETTVPIWHTNVSTCAMQITPTSTTALNATIATNSKRQDLTPTSTTTELTYIGVACISIQSSANCPASLQSTTRFVRTTTMVTSVASGADVSWPTAVQSVVTSTATFGSNAMKLTTTSGSPVSYVPTSSATASGGKGQPGQHGLPRRTVLGVGIGTGVGVLLLIVGLIIMRKRRENYITIPEGEVTTKVADPYDRYKGDAASCKSIRKPDVCIMELRELQR